MILRRFTKHVGDQNWFAVCLDVVVVISGILLALAIEDAMNDRKEAKRERVYLELLVRDLGQMEEEIQSQIDYGEETIEFGIKLSQIINGESVDNRPKAVGLLLNTLTGRRTLLLESAAYTDLKSAGNLGLISDQALRDDIITFFARSEREELIVAKNNRFFVDESFTPFIFEFGVSYSASADDPFARRGGGAKELDKEYLRRATPNMLDVQDEVLSRDLSDPAWRELERRLSWRLMIAINNKGFAEQMLKNTSGMRNEIEAYIAAH